MTESLVFLIVGILVGVITTALVSRSRIKSLVNEKQKIVSDHDRTYQQYEGVKAEQQKLSILFEKQSTEQENLSRLYNTVLQEKQDTMLKLESLQSQETKNRELISSLEATQLQLNKQLEGKINNLTVLQHEMTQQRVYYEALQKEKSEQFAKLSEIETKLIESERNKEEKQLLITQLQATITEQTERIDKLNEDLSIKAGINCLSRNLPQKESRIFSRKDYFY